MSQAAADPDVPINDGSPAIKVMALGRAPNPTPPAWSARALAKLRVFNAVMMALEVVPERVIAPGYDTTTAACLSEFRNGKYNIYLKSSAADMAAVHSDGVDGIDCALSNCSNIPMEAMELDYVFRAETYAPIRILAARANTGAASASRRATASWKTASPIPTATASASRPRPLRRWSRLPRGKPHRTRRRDHPGGDQSGLELKKGDLLAMRTGGGGGYGDDGARRTPGGGRPGRGPDDPTAE